MKEQSFLSACWQILLKSCWILLTRPYLLLYNILPVALPLVLHKAAFYHRMFDLVFHYSPVMTSATYALIGVQLLCSVYLARRTVAILRKESIQLSQARMLLNALLWITLVISGMFVFEYMAKWTHTTIRNPSIVNYAEPHTIAAQFLPLIMFIAVVLLCMWQLTDLVVPIIAARNVSLPSAVAQSLYIAWQHVGPYLCLVVVFMFVELVPLLIPLTIPRGYHNLMLMLPYGIQLISSTLSTVAYCVFYTTYTNTEKL